MAYAIDSPMQITMVNAERVSLNPKNFLARQDEVHKVMPPPPTNYKRKSARVGTASTSVKPHGTVSRLTFHSSKSQISEFHSAQRKHTMNQVHESDVGEVGETTGYTHLDIALLEFILAPDSTTPVPLNPLEIGDFECCK